jgi:hypothetical protein
VVNGPGMGNDLSGLNAAAVSLDRDVRDRNLQYVGYGTSRTCWILDLNDFAQVDRS